MSGSPRPRVVVSRCLGFAAVRYDGRALRSRFVEALRGHVEFVQVCPEVGIGLGVPRDPIRIEVGAEAEGAVGAVPGGGAAEPGLRLVQPSTGRDLTGAMRSFSDAFLGEVGPVDGFVLKARSPSCGVVDAKRFPGPGDEPLEGRGPGLFAAAVLERFPTAAVEDEERLTDPRLRHRFLTHLYAAARLRAARKEGDMEALLRFHAEHELVLLARGEDAAREMARVAADRDGRSAEEAFEAYGAAFARAMARPPGRRASRAAPRAGSLPDHLDGTGLLQPRLARRRHREPYPRALLDPGDRGGAGP